MVNGRMRGLFVVGLLLVCGCSRQDADRLARVTRKAVAKVEALTGAAPDRLAAGWQAMRAGWDEAALDGRVAERLQWDRALTGAQVRVQAAGGGVVELQGTVTSENQRSRAVELAQATVGVESVVDKLEVSGAAP
jgi:osmotically-inducible protein OsmY